MLNTKRLLLRAALATDLSDLFEVFGNDRAMKFWSTPPDINPAATRARLDRMIKPSTNPLTYFAIEMDGKVIGTAGMHSDNEVGFILHPEHWRKGIITEAMQTIIPYLFETTDVKELTADADPKNQASIRLLRKLGFAQTGNAKNTFCINGVWSDSTYFALQRPC